MKHLKNMTYLIQRMETTDRKGKNLNLILFQLDLRKSSARILHVVGQPQFSGDLLDSNKLNE